MPLILLATDLDILRPVNQPVHNSRNNFFKRSARFSFQCTFPYGQDVPAVLLEFVVVSQVNFPVSGKFFPPKLLPGFWPFEQMAVVPMPETPVDKDDRIIFWQDQVRFTGKTFVVKPVTESFSEKRFSYHQLWLGVLSTDAGHHAATRLLANNISHMIPCSCAWFSIKNLVSLLQYV